MIDLHCHILPGIDDGPKTLDEALSLCELLLSEGVEIAVTTPHFFHHRFPNPTGERINSLLEAVKQGLSGRLRIASGAEVMVVPELKEVASRSSLVAKETIVRHPSRVASEKALTRDPSSSQRPEAHDRILFLNSSHYMLVEFPYNFVPHGVENLFFELMLSGVKLFIAHPERNEVLATQPEKLAELVRLGCYSQVDAPSVAGDTGNHIKKTVLRWIGIGLVHCVASDAHNCNVRPPRLQRAYAEVQKAYGEDVAHALFIENPRAVLNDQELPFVPELSLVRESKRELMLQNLLK